MTRCLQQMPQMAQMGHYGGMPQQQYAYAMGVQGMPGYAYPQPQYYYAATGAGALPSAYETADEAVSCATARAQRGRCACMAGPHAAVQMHAR